MCIHLFKEPLGQKQPHWRQPEQRWPWQWPCRSKTQQRHPKPRQTQERRFFLYWRYYLNTLICTLAFLRNKWSEQINILTGLGKSSKPLFVTLLAIYKCTSNMNLPSACRDKTPFVPVCKLLWDRVATHPCPRKLLGYKTRQSPYLRSFSVSKISILRKHQPFSFGLFPHLT